MKRRLADSRRALGDVTGSERSLADGTHRGAKHHAGFQVLRAADERDPLSNVSIGFDRCVGSGDLSEIELSWRDNISASARDATRHCSVRIIICRNNRGHYKRSRFYR